MANTRWNPSMNGPMHIGHYYSLLANEYIARSTGGNFNIRLDDTTPVACATGERLPEIIHAYEEILCWLEVEMDEFDLQSDLMLEVNDILCKYMLDRLVDPLDGEHFLPPAVARGMDWIPYPYAPHQTAERVVMDHLLDITHVIRGDEFLTEFSLYKYFCDVMGYPHPQFYFLPRLRSSKGDISKTNGGFTLAEFRARGYTPQQLKDMVTQAALIYPANGFELYNLKAHPRIDL